MVTTECRRCHRPIVWTITANDKKMPVDAEPSVRGTVLLLDPESNTPLCRVMKKGEHRVAGEPRYTSHFQTCGK